MLAPHVEMMNEAQMRINLKAWKKVTEDKDQNSVRCLLTDRETVTCGEKDKGGGATTNATQTSPTRHAVRKRRLENGADYQDASGAEGSRVCIEWHCPQTPPCSQRD